MAADPAALGPVLVFEPSERLESMAALLEDGSLDLASRRPRLEVELGGASESIGRIHQALQQWGERGDSVELLVEMIRIELERRRLAEQEDTKGELVWTGPPEGHPTARRTEQVLHEMLTFASSSVLVVGYSLFLAGPAAKKLLDRLGELGTQGVEIVFIVDWRYRGWDGRGEEGHSVREIQEHWPSGRRRPAIWSWSSEVDASSKLHAKVVAVDDDDVLVTSANLTGGGIQTNLEFGLRARGRVARDCAAHFRALIASGLLKSQAWPED